MLMRKDAIAMVEAALKAGAARVPGVKFYPHYEPLSSGNKRIFLSPLHKGTPHQRETLTGNRRVSVDYTFDVGIYVSLNSERAEAIESAESDVDTILASVIAELLKESSISLGEEEFYVGKGELGTSAVANIEVKVSDFDG